MQQETVADGVQPIAPEAHVFPTSWPETAFEFHGSAREYFRIWIVNLALSIVTLGIYSAWASVRTRRYFYANIRLAGSPFEYNAQPQPILRGRLIAALMFGCYVLAGRTSHTMQLIAAAVIAIILPWLIVRGLSFRARYSAWRGLSFRFDRDYPGAYKWYLAMYLLIPLTLGLIYPWIKAKQQQWTVGHHRYGNAPFDFKADVTDYYLVVFATIGIILALALVLGLAFGGFIATVDRYAGTDIAKAHPLLFLGVIYALYVPAYLMVYAYNRSRMLNLLYNGAQLAGGHRLRSTLGCMAMFWIYFSNLVAIVCTLGMATAWAKVRMVRYRAAHLVLQPAGDLDAFVAATGAQTEVGALGAEMDGFFSIDIGL